MEEVGRVILQPFLRHNCFVVVVVACFMALLPAAAALGVWGNSLSE
jgi:hypothetical protein